MTKILQSGVFDSTLLWLAAYCIHSTILLGGVWLGGRFLGRRRLGIQEALWRVALVGGLVTATLQMATGLRPLGGELQLAGPGLRAEMTSNQQITTSSPAAGIPSIDEIDQAGITGGDGALFDRRASQSEDVLWPGLTEGWPMIVLMTWAVGVVVAVLALLQAHRRLRRLLRTGRSLPEGRHIRILAKTMGVRRPVAVRVSPAFGAPFATGVFKPRICIPDFTVRELAPAEVENLLAHEMAHLARRDPAWIIFCRLLEGVFFFQPLNRLARRHLEVLAECLCDDRAISCTGRPLDLARCLLQVAEKRTLARPLLVAAAAASHSRLAFRIERLLQPALRNRPCGRWVMVVLSVCLLGATAVLPAISASDIDDPPRPAGLAVVFRGEEAREEPPEPPEPTTAAEAVEEPAPPAQPAPLAPPKPVSESEVEDLIVAERLEMLAQLEADVAASAQGQSSRLERTTGEDEAALAAATEAAMRAIEEHIAALEKRLLALEEHRRELEAARRAEFEEQRHMENERRQAEQMARERAEFEEQEKQRDEQLARERAEQEQQ